MKKQFSKHLKECKNNISLQIGNVKLIKKIGEGGNGLVYQAEIFGKLFAIKFLVTDSTIGGSKGKNQRFLAEYFNVQDLENKKGLVEYIDFDIYSYEHDGDLNTVPLIIMRLYEKSLKFKSTIERDDFIKLFTSLSKTLGQVHSQGIIHRDIKPENILVKNDDYYLADFGIASYNPEIFEFRAKTLKGERVGNRLFSAPEQEDSNSIPHQTMDIYAFGQVLQWFVFGRTHRGTNRKNISSKIEGLQLYDRIISKCLSNEPGDRYQSFTEIETVVNSQPRRKDPWDCINQFHYILSRNFPRKDRYYIHSNNPKRIDNLLNDFKENEDYFGNNLIQIDLGGWDEFKLMQKESGIWKFWLSEYNISDIYIHKNSSKYYDFVLVKYRKGKPFIFEGEETYSQFLVDGKHSVTYSEVSSGFAEINDEIIRIDQDASEETYRQDKDGLFVFCTRFHSAFNRKNETLLRDYLKSIRDSIDGKEFHDFALKLSQNIISEVALRL